MIFEIIITLVILSAIIFVYYVPIYWIKDVDDVGYYNMKKPAINRARKLRKIGSKLPPPFPNGWFKLAESCEVKPGSAISIDCLGENFVVFRSQESQKVFVLDAYCPHMGANLGVGGVVRGECIECPFHDWKFNGETGQCVNIPYSDGLGSLEKTKVKKWISQEVNGLIFVWYHREDESPWNIPIVTEIDDKSWIFHGKNEFLVNSHIQDIPENGADVAHLKSVHSSSLLTGTDIRFKHSSLLSIGNHIWDAKWKAGSDDQKHIATIQLTHFVKLYKAELFQVTASIQQLGPGYVLLHLNSSFGPIMILQTLTPVEPLVQKLCHYFYGPRYNALWVKMTVIAESINVERDVAIWNNKQFVHNPILPKEDKMIKLFRTWYGQFYSANSKQFSDAYENLEW